MHDKFKPVRKKGAYNATRTKKWDGKKWVAVNVVHKGQKATLNGKPVVADGKGSWRSPGTRGNSLEGTKPGKAKGSYQAADSNRKPSTTSKPKPTAKPQVGRNWSKPHGQVSNKPSEGDRSTWAKSKPQPKPQPTTTTRSTPTTSSSTTSSSTTSTPRTTTRTTQKKAEGGMDANYKAWAKAHPELAKKVKKGQAGYEAIHGSTSSTPAAPKATGAFKPGGTAKFPEGRRSTNKPKIGTNENPIKPSGSAKFPERTGSVLKPAGKVPARQGVTKGIRAGARTDARNQVVKGARAAAKADKSPGQRASLKTTSAKPLAVPLNQIPKDLTGAAGRKYLADLDAGKLTRKRK